MKHCLVCGSPSGRCKFCKECERKKHRSSAIVSQNTRKLIGLLKTRWITTSGFEKFLVYTDNIRKHGKVLIGFKSAEELKNIIVIHNLGLDKE